MTLLFEWQWLIGLDGVPYEIRRFEQIVVNFPLPAVSIEVVAAMIPAGTKLQASVVDRIMLGSNPDGRRFFIPQPPTPSVFSTWFTNGTMNIEGPMPQDVMDWTPGSTLELVALEIKMLWYSLNPETGVAREITRGGMRPW